MQLTQFLCKTLHVSTHKNRHQAQMSFYKFYSFAPNYETFGSKHVGFYIKTNVDFIIKTVVQTALFFGT
jgi:hypothetical protein